MSYTVRTTFIKSNDTKWFAQAHPALARKFKNVDRARTAGQCTQSVEQVDENTVVITNVWNDEQSYRSFVTKAGTSIADIVRRQYIETHGISVTVEVL